MDNSNLQMPPQQPQQAQPNPLQAHFRQAKISLTLPSGGKWWGDGALNLPPNGEIPVYAMTAKDEIKLRSPDALINGTALVDVIQSCCPNIIDAWQMPSVDTDAILIAIRIASFGDQMDITSTCPKCEEESTFGVSLGTKLAEIHVPNYDDIILHDGLQIKLIPQQYYNVNRLSQVRFQENRIAMLLVDAEMPEEQKGKELQDSFQRIIDLGIENATESTEYIVLEDGTKVYSKQHIQEYYSNADSRALKSVQDKLEKFLEESRANPLKLKCQHCENEYQSQLEFDYTAFFGTASSS